MEYKVCMKVHLNRGMFYQIMFHYSVNIASGLVNRNVGYVFLFLKLLRGVDWLIICNAKNGICNIIRSLIGLLTRVAGWSLV